MPLLQRCICFRTTVRKRTKVWVGLRGTKLFEVMFSDEIFELPIGGAQTITHHLCKAMLSYRTPPSVELRTHPLSVTSATRAALCGRCCCNCFILFSPVSGTYSILLCTQFIRHFCTNRYMKTVLMFRYRVELKLIRSQRDLRFCIFFALRVRKFGNRRPTSASGQKPRKINANSAQEPSQELYKQPPLFYGTPSSLTEHQAAGLERQPPPRSPLFRPCPLPAPPPLPSPQYMENTEWAPK